MKRFFLSAMASLLSLFWYGQHLNRNLQSLIDTELAFARMAQMENSRDAFLHYLSDETVMFMDGEIKIGKKAWQNRKPDSSLLIWTPVFADISSSGDFGYTTGPSEYYASRTKGEQAFYGSYVTMWRKDADQTWKMALDMGIYPQPRPTSRILQTAKAVADNKNARYQKNVSQDLMMHEKIFIRDLASGRDPVTYFGNEPRLLRAGIQPVLKRSAISELLGKEAGKVTYHPVDVVTSPAGDMAYVYGRVTINTSDKPVQGYYLRIYRKESGAWKVVLDAIHE